MDIEYNSSRVWNKIFENPFQIMLSKQINFNEEESEMVTQEVKLLLDKCGIEELLIDYRVSGNESLFDRRK